MSETIAFLDSLAHLLDTWADGNDDYHLALTWREKAAQCRRHAARLRVAATDASWRDNPDSMGR